MVEKKAIGGALLVGGTAIGAGMLALPVVTGFGGFLPATLMYILCWLFSAATGLLFFEICLWMPKDANIISMSDHLLGKVGRWGAWLLYLFLFYCLTVAYVSGGGEMVASFLHLPSPLGIVLFTLVFGLVVYFGTVVVDRVNYLLMAGLICTFLLFLVMGVSHIKPHFLTRMHFGSALFALPVIFTSFSYQGVIPSLSTYMERHVRPMRFAILVGTALPLVAYIMWEALILGMVPESVLVSAKEAGRTAMHPLRETVGLSKIGIVGQFFGFFSITTSFLGVTLGLMDFLSDGLQVAKVGVKKVGLALLIYIPPIVISLINPFLFLAALGYAGGVGCAILLGLYPALMVWRGRYHLHYGVLHAQLPGGRVMLSFLMVFVVFELFIQLFGSFL